MELCEQDVHRVEWQAEQHLPAHEEIGECIQAPHEADGRQHGNGPRPALLEQLD